jgi:hypothetical protein
MGFKILYVQIYGKTPEQIYEELSLKPTGQFYETAEAPITGAVLPNSSYLISSDNGIPDESLFTLLSKEASLLVNYVHEGVMVSFASA